MPMPVPDETRPEYVQHVEGGGCPSWHKDAQLFCQDRDGHYDFFKSRHWNSGVVMAGRMGMPIESYRVTWV